MLTIIKGRKITEEVRAYLESKGYTVLPYLPKTLPEKLPQVVRPKVLRVDGKFGCQQFRIELTNYDYIYVRTKSAPRNELVVRRFRENDRDEIHMVLGSRSSFEYAALTTEKFVEMIDSNALGGTAISVVSKLMYNMLLGKIDYLDFVPEDAGWSEEDFILKLGWNWYLE